MKPCGRENTMTVIETRYFAALDGLNLLLLLCTITNAEYVTAVRHLVAARVALDPGYGTSWFARTMLDSCATATLVVV